MIKGVKAFNGDDRTIYLTNEKLRGLIRNYIKHRVNKAVGLGSHPDEPL